VSGEEGPVEAPTKATKPTRRRRRSVAQVTFKVQRDFLERFDRVAEALGYDRTEAIREAMRRFVDEHSRRLGITPEGAVQRLRQVIEEGIVAPLMKLKGLEGAEGK